jgi:hypothetical protein
MPGLLAMDYKTMAGVVSRTKTNVQQPLHDIIPHIISYQNVLARPVLQTLRYD